MTRRGKYLTTSSRWALALVLASVVPALADGIPTTERRLTIAPRSSNSAPDASVSVDLSALENTNSRRLLVSASGGSSERIVLRPPSGLAPLIRRQEPIRLRPPPGMAPLQTARLTPPAAAPVTAPIAVEPVAPIAPAPVPAKPVAAKPAPAPAKPAAAPPAPPQPAAAPKPAAPAKPVQSAAVKPQAPAATPAKPAPSRPATPPPPPARPAAAPPAAKPAPPVAVAKPAAPPAKPVQTAAITPQAASAPTPRPTTSSAANAPTPITPPAAAPPAAKTVAGAPPTLVPDATTAKETQVAALPSTTAPTPRDPDIFTISYGIGGSDVPAQAGQNLRAVAARMAKDPALRVELIAYASDPEGSVSRSRRLSTERGVNVRRELLDAGVESTRINLRALGEQSGDGAPDRVDVLLVRR